MRNCETSFDMWESLKSFYELQGEIEIANATAQLSAIIMGEAEDLAVYVFWTDWVSRSRRPNKQRISSTPSTLGTSE